MNHSQSKVDVRLSGIEGLGVFANRKIAKGEVVLGIIEYLSLLDKHYTDFFQTKIQELINEQLN